MQTPPRRTSPIIQFDVFTVDVNASQLWKRKRPLRVQALPLRLLITLLGRPGEIVSREELRVQLWGDTVVDFDDGLHQAVRKLREVLGDSASHPRFIETIPRQGYRFIASISMGAGEHEAAPDLPSAEFTAPPVPQNLGPQPIVQLSGPRNLWLVRVGGILVLAIVLILVTKDYRVLSQPSEVVPITSEHGVQRSPALSPDGTRFAFTWAAESNENLDIYVQNVDGTGRLRLTRGIAPNRNPAWSPDGKTIAYIRDDHVFSIPATGGPETNITSASGPGLSWGPDSAIIAISDREAPDGPLTIFLASVKSKERRRLTSPVDSKQDDLWPAFSPEGESVAFVRRSTPTVTDIYRVPVSGGDPIRVAKAGRPIRGLVWSPDSKFLLFATGKQAPGLLAVPANGHDVEHFERVDAAGSNVYEPCIVGRRGGKEVDLAYGHETSDWDIQGTALGLGPISPTTLVSSSRDDQAPRFSPDGLRIAFDSARSGYEEIWVSMRDGSDPHQLTHFDSLASSPRWSPDGQWIVFDATVGNNRDIYIVGSNRSSLRRLTHEASVEAQPSWSRDGRRIYFMSDRSGTQQIWRMDVEGGPPIQVTRQGGYEAVESTDGKTLYYAKRQARPGLWRVPVNGGTEVLVSDSVRQNLWSLVGDGLFYFDLDGQIPQVFEVPRPVPVKRIDLATNVVKTVAVITTDLPDGVPALEVSPDATYLAWVTRREHNSELMLVRNLHLPGH